MISRLSWKNYPKTYRTKELRLIAGWIQAGQSGSVIGLPGFGKSNLLNLLYSRPEIISTYLPSDFPPVITVLVDLYNVPRADPSTFYRVILQSFYEIRNRFSEEEVIGIIVNSYQMNRDKQDPFLLLSAIRELLFIFQELGYQVVLVFDHFDQASGKINGEIANVLYGLYLNFEGTINYIVGLKQVFTSLSDIESLGELYKVLDINTCWVGLLDEQDAQYLIRQQTAMAHTLIKTEKIKQIISLSGGHLELLKAVCQWWLQNSERNDLPLNELGHLLSNKLSVKHRLAEIWDSLSREEQQALSALQKEPDTKQPNSKVLQILSNKGVCLPAEGSWYIVSKLLAHHINMVSGLDGGRIWMDKATGQFYQGETIISGLSPLEVAILSFFIQHPKKPHTKTTLIEIAWPDTLRRDHGISDESLYQVISKLRSKIEPNRSKPQYIISWRGQTENGYNFFPDGSAFLRQD